MKKWEVNDITWANTDDLHLPFWQKWNQNNPLPKGFWQRIWEYPYVASKIPQSASSLDIGGTYPFVLFKNFPQAISVDSRDLNTLEHPLHRGLWSKDKLIVCDAANIPVDNNSYDYVFSISAIEEMPHTLQVLKEMIRIAKYRVVITMDVSDTLGIPINKLREVEEFLHHRIPSLPPNAHTSISDILTEYEQVIIEDYRHIRVLAFTIDSRDNPKSIAILIPHWNSWHFLKPCLESIQKNKNKTLQEKIYVLDDASDDGSYEKAVKMFKKDTSIEFHRFERPNKHYESDIGLLLDYGLKLIKEQYVAMIDADVFPLSKDWLAFPIWLSEQYHCSSVGLDTGLSTSYLNRMGFNNWWQPEKGYIPCAGLYDNQWFSCTNNLFRVMNSALAKIVSENIGFTRATPTYTIFHKLVSKNRRFPYLPGGEDNGVAANHFIDINRMGPKFNIPLTSYIGLTPKDGAFGQNISGLIFHFALSTRALSVHRREIQDAGKTYNNWVEKLNDIKTINDSSIQQMISESRHFQPGRYDGSIPVSWYKREYAYIQKLIKKYHEHTSHR